MLPAFAATEVREPRIVPSRTRVADPEECDRYWRTVLALWRLPDGMRHFPGSHPVPVDAARARAVRESDRYLVSLKTDGVRYLLLTLRPDGAHRAWSTARSSSTRSACGAARALPRGTLLDGELAGRGRRPGAADDDVLRPDAVASAGGTWPTSRSRCACR